MQTAMKRDATCYESGHPLHGPAGTRAVRRDRLSALNQWLLENQSIVYNLAYRILGDPELAIAATEETFLRESPVRAKSRRTSPRLWLMRTTVTVCNELLVRLPHLGPNSCDRMAGDNTHETITAPTAPQPSPADLQALLNTIPPDQRVTLVLSDVQGLSYREIADVTGVSVDVVRSRLSRGRTALRNALLQRGEISPGVQP